MTDAKRTGHTAIAHVDLHGVSVHGKDLSQELIGKIGFTAYFLFLLTGRQPDEKLVAITDACLVAIAEHGLVPSVQAARMTLAAAPDALQGAVAAGVLGCGSVILG
ncbi:citrate/2-methylcitrate synthase, partial [Cupriavidus necator]